MFTCNKSGRANTSPATVGQSSHSKKRNWRTRVGSAALLACAFVTALSQAGSLSVHSPMGRFAVPVKSLAEQRWNTVIPQQYDFSCGSAAIATLLTHHYEKPVKEDEVFRAMFAVGNQENIRRLGFSLLDMKRYLDSLGLHADGFRFELDTFAKLKVPGITLINTKGYKHFVVVKGVSATHVLIADPAAGTMIVPRAQFKTLWTGAVLAARADIETAQRNFNKSEDWALLPRSPLSGGVNRNGLGNFLLNQPGARELGQ